MKNKFVIFSVGKLLEILSIILLVPCFIAWCEIPDKSFPLVFFHKEMVGFLLAIILSWLAGNFLKRLGSTKLTGNGIREGFAIVTFGWIALSFFGAIPLLVYFLATADVFSIQSFFLAFTDAYFEIMSGFSTTGSTILTDIEILPQGLLFWRSLTHWLGGMGIVTLALAILPAFGVASYQMFKGEVPGPTAELLKPRLAQTAKILWGTYVILTFAEVFFLKLGGMSIFEAVCHSFATMATGGFSTRNTSIAAFNSSYIDWVIIVFMFFAGMNFIIHYRIFFARKFDLLRNNREFHFYIGVVVLAILLGVIVLQFNGIASNLNIVQSFRNVPLSDVEVSQKIINESAKVSSFLDVFRHVAFQVLSITTTTGFCTADFDVWPNFLRFMLVALMFFGGCAGSTGGGMKMIRIMIMIKTGFREIKAMIQPRLMLPIKIAGEAIDDKQVSNILGFVILFIGSFVFFSGVMCFFVPDLTTAVTSVVATMCNIGPGLAGVGANENYAWISMPGKWVLIFCMLLGRLEIYTVFIAFSCVSWRK